MATDESQAGERFDRIHTDQQKESTNENHRTIIEKQVTQEQAKTSNRQEQQQGEQESRNDKKEPRRVTRGREGWGGYQGY